MTDRWDRIVRILDIYVEGFSARFFARPNGNSLVLTREKDRYEDEDTAFDHIERFRIARADPLCFTRAPEWLGVEAVRFTRNRLPAG